MNNNLRAKLLNNIRKEKEYAGNICKKAECLLFFEKTEGSFRGKAPPYSRSIRPSAAGDLDHRAGGDLDLEGLLRGLDDRAHEAAREDDLRTRAELLDHLPALLLLALLRTDHHEVEDREDQQHRDEHPHSAPLGVGRGRSRITEHQCSVHLSLFPS